MAEGGGKIVEVLEKEITCAICHEHYKEPKVLPCCHYYCKHCLHQLSLRSGVTEPFSCPECRKDATLPEGNIDKLPTAFFVNRMQEVYSRLGLAQGKVEAKCEACQEARAEAFCRQCAKFLCSNCVKAHQQLKKMFSGHVVSTLEELKNGKAEDVIVQEPSFQSCQVHKQPMTVYCFSCKSLICRDCAVKIHREHNYEFVIVAAPEIRKNLLQKLDALRDSLGGIHQQMEGTQTLLSEMKHKKQSLLEDIEAHFENLQKIMDYYKQQVIMEANVKIDQIMKSVSEQEKGLSFSCAALQSVIDYTEQCVQHAGDDEIVCMQTEVQDRINRGTQEEGTELIKAAELIEGTEVGLDTTCTEDFKKLLRTKVKLVQLPVDCVLKGEMPSCAEVGKLCQFEVQTRLRNGRPTSRSCKVECHLKSIVSDSVARCQIEQIDRSEYRVEFTPTVRGCHEVKVMIEEASNCFPLFVYISPTLLGIPVEVAQVDGPFHIAINSAGDMFVTEYSRNNVVIFSENKKILDTFKYGIEASHGVAVDSNNMIYISGNDRIIKLNPDFELLSSNTVLGAYFERMTIVEDEVMVCTSRAIFVFSKDLEYIRQLCLKQFGDIRDVSSDEESKLYATDRVNKCIHVLTKNGSYLYSMAEELQYPVGLHTHGQHVYVADWDRSCVSVYTTTGEYVTYIGQKGDFYCPNGLCIDKDGFVYVTEYGNNRVQKF